MITIEPLTAARWDDFATVCRQMDPNRSCWCRWWRRPSGPPPPGSAQLRAHALVAAAERPIGLLAYDGATPVGWVAVAPRDEYPGPNQGRDTAPVDDVPGTWAIPCFPVLPSHRGPGVAHPLLHAAVECAAAHDATAVDRIRRPPANATERRARLVHRADHDVRCRRFHRGRAAQPTRAGPICAATCGAGVRIAPSLIAPL